MLPPINPADFGALGPAVAAAGLGVEGRRRWRLSRKQRAAQLREARLLYLEVVGNLVWGRVAWAAHPPQLPISSSEWRRPGTPALLVELLDDPRKVTLVAAAYVMLDVYERLFRLPWVELLAVRLAGTDVVTIGQVVERLAEAERVLRPVLYDKTGQANMEKALAEVFGQTPSPSRSRTARLSNAWGSIPTSLQLAVLLAMGGWRAASLMRSWRRRAVAGPTIDRRAHGAPTWPGRRRLVGGPRRPSIE